MKKNILLAVASIACIAVWTSFYLFITDNKTNQASPTELVELNSGQEISNLVLEEVIQAEAPQHPEEKNNYATEGIQRGDFADIAPDKIISVEALLDRIK